MGASEIRKILIKVEASGLSGIDAVAKKLDQLNAATKSTSDNMAFLIRIAKGLAVAFVVSEIKDFIQGVIQTGVELKNMSQAVGISVEELARIKVAAELSGVPMDSLTVALRRLSASMVAASTGNTAVAGSFKSFGVSVTDVNGKLRPTTDVLLRLADRFKDLEDGPAKTALAIKLFGRSGSDIIPLLNLGSEAIQKFSLNIDSDFAASSKQFVNNVQIMKLELRNLALDGFGAVLPALNNAIEKFDEYDIHNETVGKKSKALAGITTLLAIALHTVYETLATLGDLLISTFYDIIVIVVGAFKTFIGTLDDVADRVNALREGDFKSAFFPDSSKAVDAFSSSYDKILKEGESFATKAQNNFYAAMNYSKDLEDKLEFGYTKDSGDKKKKGSVDPGEINKKLAHERELLAVLKDQGQEQVALGNLELRKYSLSAVAYENEMDRYKTELAIQKATKDFNLKNKDEASLAQQYRTEAELQEKAREQNRLALDEQKRGLEGFKVGATEAYRSYIDSATDAAAQTKQLFTDAFKGMENGIVSFVKTGKFNFTDFANSIIDDIIRIQIRMALAGLLGQIVGSFAGGAASGGSSGGGGAFGNDYNVGSLPAAPSYANGGIMTSRGNVPLRKYASGGIARSPQMAMFGEGSTPEAYVPVPSGRIPVELNGSGGSNVEVNVYMATGQTDTKASSADAEKLGVLISNVVKKEIVNQKRSGGLLSR